MASQGSTVNISDLMTRVKRQLAEVAASDASGAQAVRRESVLAATAARYSAADAAFSVTPPTGFDPEAAALFEAIVETAFLVANADGEFDDKERDAFTFVVREAAERRVSERQLNAIVLDLSTQLTDDGIERRVEHLGRAIARPSDRQEALRIAALLALASAGVSEVERQILERLAAVWELPVAAVDKALSEAEKTLDA